MSFPAKLRAMPPRRYVATFYDWSLGRTADLLRRLCAVLHD